MPPGHPTPLIPIFLLAVAAWLLTGCGGRAPALDEERALVFLSDAHTEASVFNYNRAYDLYGQARARAERGGDTWIESTFGLATAGWHRLPPNRASILEARGLFEELAELLPENSSYLPRVLLNLGRIIELRNFPGDTVDPELARTYYERVRDKWEGTIHADEAAGRIAANALHYVDDPERVRAGLEELESYLERRPDSPIANVLWYFLGDKYWFFLDDAEKSFAALERSVELGLVERARAWHTFWRMARMARENLNDPVLAASYYARIVQEAPRSPRVHEALLAYNELRERYPDELPELESLPFTLLRND